MATTTTLSQQIAAALAFFLSCLTLIAKSMSIATCALQSSNSSRQGCWDYPPPSASTPPPPPFLQFPPPTQPPPPPPPLSSNIPQPPPTVECPSPPAHNDTPSVPTVPAPPLSNVPETPPASAPSPNKSSAANVKLYSLTDNMGLALTMLYMILFFLPSWRLSNIK